jgi:hypothetical protein
MGVVEERVIAMLDGPGASPHIPPVHEGVEPRGLNHRRVEWCEVEVANHQRAVVAENSLCRMNVLGRKSG